MTPGLSVVIPTRDRRELLEAELRALARQTLSPERYEVIVVVDGSSDGTLEAVDAFEAPYQLRAIGQPGRGRAAACNTGIRAARGEVLVLLDDDMLPSPELLAAHLHAHESGGQLGVIGPAPIEFGAHASRTAQYIGTKFNRHLDNLAAGAPIGFHDLYTGNFSIRRTVLEDVGLFDEGFRVYGNEDGELGVRLLLAGVRLIYCPAAVAHQRYAKDFRALARDNVAKGRTAVILARKHPETAAELQFGRQASRKRRLARRVLLVLSRLRPETPRIAVRLVELLERRRPSLALRVYPAVLDYFYWLGASAELRRREASPTPAAVHDGGLR